MTLNIVNLTKERAWVCVLGGGGGAREGESTPFMKSLLDVLVPPPPPPPPSQIQFLAHNATQSRGVTKNVVLVGTIIMLVASVRRMFC